MLFNKHPLVVDKELAAKIGLNEAMILQQVHYWMEINKKNKRNYHEGRQWTYNTIDEWTEEFPFWSKQTVKRTFKNLRDLGFIIVDNFNAYKFDKTLWYTIDYDKLNESIGSNSPKEDIQNEPMDENELNPTIPEITSENSPEISNQSINQSNQDKDIKQKEMDRQMEYETIIRNCELDSIDQTYRTGVEHSIKLLLVDIENSTRIKIGDNYYPVEIIKKDMNKLNFFVIDHAINKFKEASENYVIKNPISYLKACIYNAIYAIDIDVDSKLRSAGLI